MRERVARARAREKKEIEQRECVCERDTCGHIRDTTVSKTNTARNRIRTHAHVPLDAHATDTYNTQSRQTLQGGEDA